MTQALTVIGFLVGWFVLVQFLENLAYDSRLEKWANEHKLRILHQKKYFSIGRSRVYDVTLEDCNGTTKNARLRIRQPFMKLHFEVEIDWQT